MSPDDFDARPISGVPRPETPAIWQIRGAAPSPWAFSPDQYGPRHLHDVIDVLEPRREHRLQQVKLALHNLVAHSNSGWHLLVLTDARADRLEFSEGSEWSEAGIGASALREALVAGRPAQLYSAEHLIRPP